MNSVRISLRGHIENGVIVPDQAIPLPEHQPLLIQLQLAAEDVDEEPDDDATVLDRYRHIISPKPELPPDLAVNIDHYLYGQPKRE